MTMRTAASESRLLTIMRQGLTRDQTKYSVGGRENRRTPPVPSMPALRCLRAVAPEAADRKLDQA